MLVLVRRPSESIIIGNDIVVTIVKVQGSAVRVGIDAPRDMRVDREEIRERITREQERSSGAERRADSSD